MSTDTIYAVSPEEYLEQERESDLKCEYISGEIVAIEGGSAQHSTIKVNLTAHLYHQLMNGTCRIFDSDIKVCTSLNGLYVYPDLTVVCGTPIFLDEHLDILTNPTLIVEVLTPASQSHDYFRKWVHYQKMPSLTNYLMVAQETLQVEHFQRSVGGAWSYHLYEKLSDVINLESIDAKLTLAQIYHRVYSE